MSGTLDDHAPQGRDDASPTGSRFASRYRVVRHIGAGAMGDVYEAEQLGLARRVALKVLRRAWSGDAVSQARFRREALAAAAVRHPAVVQVYDVDHDDDGVPCIVAELLEGEDLRARLDAVGRLPLDAALGVLAPLLDALDAAHAAGVLHRDLKPENVFLARGRDGETSPRLIDFGVARLREGAAPALTDVGDVLGTPGYMAPEQARGMADLDGRVDVWSAAVLLVEMLTGALPFHATNRNALMFEVVEREARLDHEAIPAALRAILARALHRDRARRPATPRALLNELLEGAPWSDAPWCRALRATWRTTPPTRRGRVLRPVAWALVGALGLGALALLARRDAHVAAPSHVAAPPVAAPVAAPSRAAPSRAAPSLAAPSLAAPSVAPAPSAIAAPRALVRRAVRAAPSTRAVAHEAPRRDESLYTPFRSARPDRDASP